MPGTNLTSAVLAADRNSSAIPAAISARSSSLPHPKARSGPALRQDHPGACPICGMALDPATVTADSGPSPEIADMTRRFWIGLVLSFPVLLLENGRPHFPCASSCRVHGAFGPHPDGTGHAGGALGGLALFRAGLGIGANAQPQHVHADRDGDGRRLELQHGRRIQGIEERVRLLRVMNCQIYVTIGYSCSPSLLYYVS